MELQNYLSAIQQGLATSATVKAVFGEPITAEGKTIIPVARVRYGFGGGMGTGPTGNSQEQRLGQGGGGGGGVVAQPVGVVEVSSSGTRFIPVCSRKRLGGLVLAGFVAGWLWSRR